MAWIVFLLVIGGQFPETSWRRAWDVLQPNPIPQSIFTWVWIAAGYWHLFLVANTVGEVYGFSALKGFVRYLLASLIVRGPIGAIVGAVLVLHGTLNVEHDRIKMNEVNAIGNLQNMAHSNLKMYQGVNGSYPDSWQADMYLNATPDYGMPEFDLDIQTKPQTVNSYTYQYRPEPSGCTEPRCDSYTITAVPQVAGKTGTRSFFTDQSGMIHHCTGGTGADATDRTIDQRPEPC